MPDTNYDVAVLFPCKEILMNLFQNAKFFTTVNHRKDLPDTPAGSGFVGRRVGQVVEMRKYGGCIKKRSSENKRFQTTSFLFL